MNVFLSAHHFERSLLGPLKVWACLIALLVSTEVTAQTSMPNGYVLIAPLNDRDVFLINMEKQIVHTWRCPEPAGGVNYMLDDGSLLRTVKVDNPVFQARGGSTGKIQRIAWDGTLMWEFQLADDKMHLHHDVQPLANGNVLAIAWEYHSRDEAIDAGRDPKTLSQDALWPETILELQPQTPSGAKIVWQWRLWDHLIQQFDKSKANFGDVAAHPELVDLNFGIRRGNADWIHMNAVHYHPQLDQIVLSARWFDEAWVIDHSTTTAQAATHHGGRQDRGGDLLYRWGNPQSYLAGFPEDRKLFGQHDVQWIQPGIPGAGEFLLFNNGDRNERNYSSVDQFKSPVQPDGSYPIKPDQPFEPRDFSWSYSDGEAFLSNRISGAQRLASGNTLVCSGDQEWVFEVTPDGKRVWEFRTSDIDREGGLFRAPFYSATHPALANRTLNPQ